MRREFLGEVAPLRSGLRLNVLPLGDGGRASSKRPTHEKSSKSVPEVPKVRSSNAQKCSANGAQRVGRGNPLHGLLEEGLEPF